MSLKIYRCSSSCSKSFGCTVISASLSEKFTRDQDKQRAIHVQAARELGTSGPETVE